MKWGDITRAFLIVLAHRTCFISFNRLGSNLGINQSTCISWTAQLLLYISDLEGKKGQFLIYKATYLYFQMYSSLEGQLSGHPRNKWLWMVITAQKHPSCCVLSSFFFPFLSFLHVTARFFGFFFSENKTRTFISSSFTWKWRVVIFIVSPAVNHFLKSCVQNTAVLLLA